MNNTNNVHAEKPGLSVRNLLGSYLAGEINFDIAPQEVVGLLGANGSGKTTLLRALAGLSSIEGMVSFCGDELSQLSRQARARRISYMPTQRRVDWPMQVRDIVNLGLRGEVAGSDADERIENALYRLNAFNFINRRIDTLSTGEQARVLLARALVGDADLLLLDEPTANLDPGHQLEVMHVLKDEAMRGAIVIASFHDLTLAENHCSRALVMDQGHLIADGHPASILSNANLARFFGIERAPRGWQVAETTSGDYE